MKLVPFSKLYCLRYKCVLKFLMSIVLHKSFSENLDEIAYLKKLFFFNYMFQIFWKIQFHLGIFLYELAKHIAFLRSS